MKRVDTEVLIVGGGLSGLTASIVLADLGVDALLIERHASTSHLPKAHYVNQRSMEIFRRHAAADRIYERATPRDNIGKILWYTSLGGDGPLDRILWGGGDSMGAGALAPIYDAKGVTPPTNIPQVRLEPVLAQIAEERSSGRVLFQHEFVSLEQDDTGVTTVVRDLERDEDIEVRCQYVIAADAGKTVGPAVGIKVVGGRFPLDFVGVWFSADLSECVPDDGSVMRFLVHPSRGTKFGNLLAFGPEQWGPHCEEWGMSFARDPSLPPLSEEEAIAEVRTLLGVGDDVGIKVEKISQWTLEVVVADAFSRGRAFLVGDAAHKHTPGGGLGANSGMQDSHNIAWKLALVLRGQAPASLLDSYETERRPVVQRNAEWSGFTMRNFLLYLMAAGINPAAPAEQNEAAFTQMLSDTPIGEAYRALVNEVFKLQRSEIAAHDMEMGFTYDQGAVVDDGSPPAWRDPLGAEYRPTSKPGSRLPHAWLDIDGKQMSTHDLVPIDGFLLLTDTTGRDWAEAGERLADETGITIRTIRVGEDGDATDPSGTWGAAREIDDGGALLVRPDGHVGYRATVPVSDSHAALAEALAAILGGGGAASALVDAPQADMLRHLSTAFVDERQS